MSQCTLRPHQLHHRCWTLPPCFVHQCHSLDRLSYDSDQSTLQSNCSQMRHSLASRRFQTPDLHSPQRFISHLALLNKRLLCSLKCAVLDGVARLCSLCHSCLLRHHALSLLLIDCVCPTFCKSTSENCEASYRLWVFGSSIFEYHCHDGTGHLQRNHLYVMMKW